MPAVMGVLEMPLTAVVGALGNLDHAARPAVTSPAAHALIDDVERRMLDSDAPAIDLPLVHRFTPGLYVREIHMPAGTFLTSKIHNTTHPYVVTRGRVSVFIDDVGVEHITAPHVGITLAGTRRVLYIHEDTTWLTFHPNPSDTEDLGEIEQRIIERRELTDGRTTYELYQDKLDGLRLAGGVPSVGRQ